MWKRAHHFQHFWASTSKKPDVLTELAINHSFQLNKNWTLVKQNSTDFKKNFILKKLDKLFQSDYYNYLILAQIFIESIVVSTIDYNDLSGNCGTEFISHFYAELVLTLLFVTDVLLKTIIYGYKIYF